MTCSRSNLHAQGPETKGQGVRLTSTCTPHALVLGMHVQLRIHHTGWRQRGSAGKLQLTVTEWPGEVPRCT